MNLTHQTVYLKPNVIVEPLMNQWYAWSYLISPTTAARYITESHLKIMESFVEAPQVHCSALKNPEMLGGPFINYGIDRVNDVKALCAKTRDEQAHMVQLSQSIATLDQLLVNEADGYSLEPLYQKIPEPLKGYVELVYDTRNRASVRWIEGLLYHSPYYNPESQSIALYVSHEDQRSFVLSTPRLEDDHCLQLRLPFSDPRLDRLFQMRSNPQPYQEIKELLESTDEDEALFSTFFTEEAPRKATHYSGDSVRVRYFGHACVLIETQDLSILCDPLVSYQYESGVPRYTYADLPETIDYVLITHNHQDHCMFETLLQLRHKIKHLIVPKSNNGVLIDPSLKLILKHIGFATVQEIDELEAIAVPGGQIIALPFLGEHGDLNISAKAGYLIHLKGNTILCLADSNNIEPKLYEHIHQLFGDVNIIFIGMECDGAPFSWAYGPLLTQPIPRKMDATRRLDGSNAERAFALVKQFNPQQVYVYAMGQEPWLTHITSIQYAENSRPLLESNRLITACRQQNMVSDRLFGKKELVLDETARVLGSNSFSNQRDRVNPDQDQQGDQPAIQPITGFISDLNRMDIRLWMDGERLRCNAPKGTLTAELKSQLAERKVEILEFLSQRSHHEELSYERTSAFLQAEAILDASIYPPISSTPHTIPSKHIFLTGATGFLGAFLLYELLQQTQADLYCLVRSNTIELAQAKLQNCLASYQLWQESFKSRIIPVIGDLSQPLLGLTEAQFQTLADQIEVIYHNGAWVHHASPYSLLKATNVLGTQEVLRLACQSRVKPIHFMSATSVFSPPEGTETQVIRETDRLIDRVPWGGYNQSKWVAERLVAMGGDRGIPISIYRLGRLSGHSQTGVFNQNDLLYRLIIGCIQLGSAPEDKTLLDMIPIDYASRAIVHLSQQFTAQGKAFHLVHPHPVDSTILFESLRSFGYAIQSLPYGQWRAKLLQIAETSPDHALYPLVSLFPAKDETQPAEAILTFDCQNTLNGLAGSAIACPAIDQSLLHRYFSHLMQTGFLAPLPISQEK